MRLIDPIELKKSIVVSNIIGDGKTLEELIDEQPDAQHDTGLYTDGFADGYEQAIKDAARSEIIRCKDCTHWSRESICDGFCSEDCMRHDEDFYCGYAERRIDVKADKGTSR